MKRLLLAIAFAGLFAGPVSAETGFDLGQSNKVTQLPSPAEFLGLFLLLEDPAAHLPTVMPARISGFRIALQYDQADLPDGLDDPDYIDFTLFGEYREARSSFNTQFGCTRLGEATIAELRGERRFRGPIEAPVNRKALQVPGTQKFLHCSLKVPNAGIADGFTVAAIEAAFAEFGAPLLREGALPPNYDAAPSMRGGDHYAVSSTPYSFGPYETNVRMVTLTLRLEPEGLRVAFTAILPEPFLA